ncbi:hypothetical protein KL921_002041 [Ogataea angusta]|uniref:Uncharacterized protein n=1 Tax=Pichia angusta TaxID=870730 RepID=A0AAN6I6G4_PICAN|nr:uncharacterized protein KL928_002224 [Ogataea angusta]KAG7811775.1 hypothetical protein KL921_002041 [Ogataea angusta]KAG7819550.1 hypothetical protein KL928_002224 [Ogataea angusta]KAG7830879.1 hypothetical protein KL920_001470 [Ogataea angusta]KAG7835098.1 hypothetical protein KL943_002413 [Ogataea angusta]KAG7840478.1 hypothetical protein KL942_002429 [Ogataea angusta]
MKIQYLAASLLSLAATVWAHDSPHGGPHGGPQWPPHPGYHHNTTLSTHSKPVSSHLPKPSPTAGGSFNDTHISFKLSVPCSLGSASLDWFSDISDTNYYGYHFLPDQFKGYHEQDGNFSDIEIDIDGSGPTRLEVIISEKCKSPDDVIHVEIDATIVQSKPGFVGYFFLYTEDESGGHEKISTHLITGVATAATQTPTVPPPSYTHPPKPTESPSHDDHKLPPGIKYTPVPTPTYKPHFKEHH